MLLMRKRVRISELGSKVLRNLENSKFLSTFFVFQFLIKLAGDEPITNLLQNDFIGRLLPCGDPRRIHPDNGAASRWKCGR